MTVAPSTPLARFTEWITRYGDAWESADAEALGSLFVVAATFQETPFADVARGRRAIVAYFSDQFVAWNRPSFSAQVLGVGDTYGVAHWRVGTADRALDGILVAALDERGRCTSLRQWWHESVSASTSVSVH